MLGLSAMPLSLTVASNFGFIWLLQKSVGDIMRNKSPKNFLKNSKENKYD